MSATNYADRTITVYYDDETDPSNPGWVTLCSEFDEHGDGICGRTGMTEQLDATNLAEAKIEAAKHWGCDPSEVVPYEGNLS